MQPLYFIDSKKEYQCNILFLSDKNYVAAVPWPNEWRDHVQLLAMLKFLP